jgi:hypothetical protein
MSIARGIAVSALALAAALGLSGCGAMGDHKIGDAATVNFTKADSYEVTVTAIEPAPAEVAARYETEDEIYFVRFTAKAAGVEDPDLVQVMSNTYAVVEDGTVVATSFDTIEECTSPDNAQATEKLKAGEAVEACVPVAGDSGKKVTGVRMGSHDLEAAGSQTWKI